MPNPLCAEKEVKVKPYNPQGKCPKCGYYDIGTTYHNKAVSNSPCWPYVSVEHLCRRCRRCQYEWCEAALKEVTDA